MSKAKLTLTRKQLAAFLSDPDAIRVFERVLDICNTAEDAASGSNANGYYAQFSDGTMLCWATKTAVVNITNALNNWFYGSLPAWTFPKPFVGQPITQLSVQASGTVATALNGLANSITAPNAYAICGALVAGANCNIQWFAIGRWK